MGRDFGVRVVGAVPPWSPNPVVDAAFAAADRRIAAFRRAATERDSVMPSEAPAAETLDVTGLGATDRTEDKWAAAPEGSRLVTDLTTGEQIIEPPCGPVDPAEFFRSQEATDGR